LAASGGARALVVEVETVSLRDFTEDVANKYFQSISDALSPFVSK
jgi:hypothetical protein